MSSEINTQSDNIKELQNTIKSLTQKVSNLEKENHQLEFKAESLELQLRKALMHRYSRKSDKVPANQLTLNFFDEPEVPTEDVATIEKENEEITVPAHKRKKPGRKPLPKNLPREVVVHKLTAEERPCKCGDEIAIIGTEDSEQLEYVPAQIKVIVNKREKGACNKCEETIKVAALPKMPIPKSIATPSLLASVLTAKFCDHLPLYRQEQIWKRHGIDLPRQTLCNWTQKSAELLFRIIVVMRHLILKGNYARADETPTQVLNEEGRSATSKSYVWVFMSGHKTNNMIIYEYHPTRSSSVPEEFFKDYCGYLQTDMYAAYVKLAKLNENIIHIGCMAHCRRNFVDVTKIVKKTGKAHEALKYINKLYQIEKLISDWSVEERYDYRQKHAKPVLEQFKSWLDKNIDSAPPKNPLGKAIRYAYNNWDALSRYIDHGMLDIDNNWCENQIRPYALGRKNWLFNNSTKGAWASCVIYSLVITAKANGIDPFRYLMDVLAKAPYCETDEDFIKLVPTNDYFTSQ